jgi:hypothetical protein
MKIISDLLLRVCLLFLCGLAACGDVSNAEKPPFNEFFKEKKFIKRVDSKYGKTIYTYYTNDKFTSVRSEFIDSLEGKWIEKKDFAIGSEINTGSSIFYSETSDQVITISQAITSEANVVYSYIVNVIIGRDLNNPKKEAG